MKLSFSQSFEAQELTKLLEKAEPETIIQYKEMNALIKGDTQGRERTALTTARRHLLKQGYVFESISKVGIKRLHANQLAKTNPRFIAKIRRASAKQSLALGTADMAQLTVDEQKAHSQAMLQTALVAASVNKTSVKKLADESSKKPVLTLDLEAIRRIYGAS
jgi:hypothetical protein